MHRDLLDKRILFSRNPLFSGLGRDDLDHIVAIADHRHRGKYKLVFEQGDPGDEMFIIASGKVRVSVLVSEDEDLSLGELGAGDAFGEIALLDRAPRTARVTTLAACEFLVVKRDAFVELMRRRPSIAIHLLGVLTRRLRAVHESMKETLSLDIRSRLAELLHNMAHTYGRNTRKGPRIDVALNDQELGDIVGIPRDVVSAQLRHWQDEGIIKLKHGFITILKPHELERLEHHF